MCVPAPLGAPSTSVAQQVWAYQAPYCYPRLDPPISEMLSKAWPYLARRIIVSLLPTLGCPLLHLPGLPPRYALSQGGEGGDACRA